MSTPTLTAGKNPITSHNQQSEAHLHGCKWLAALVTSGEHLSSSLFLCAEAQHLRELLIVLMLHDVSLHIWGYLLLHWAIRSATVRTCYWQCGFGISTICNNVNCTENIIVLIIVFYTTILENIIAVKLSWFALGLREFWTCFISYPKGSFSSKRNPRSQKSSCLWSQDSARPGRRRTTSAELEKQNQNH